MADNERAVIFAGCRMWACVTCGGINPGSPGADAEEPRGCWVCGPGAEFIIDDLPPVLRKKAAADCDHAYMTLDGFCPDCGIHWEFPSPESVAVVRQAQEPK